jgi:hypothetical protein
VTRVDQTVLVVSTVLGSWLAMQAVHELGHVLGAWLTGGTVTQVVLSPLTISRTDLNHNPSPLFVAWSGPVFGIIAPLILWGIALMTRFPSAFVLRFFAGFCLVANGLYIALGSFNRIGDCGEMLRHGSQPWQLWLFGAIACPFGIWLWHGQGHHFGLGASEGQVDHVVAWSMLSIFAALLVFDFAWSM